MSIKPKYLSLIIIILIPILLGTFNYLIEVIIIPEKALIKLNYWGYYIFNYALFRLIFFVPAIWIYTLLFKKATKRNKALGFLYAIGVALFYALVVFSNDPRISLELSDKFMMSITYTLTAIIVYFIYELSHKTRMTRVS
ncbi:phosphoglycerol transferase MdoB-like AlkP superfamily enzyme [Pedobacter cryoconitis]|uniref:Phosphoglycerol transferase MdoB-like AlkP superfamily enzyme n=1 Tax=Pedobacter cryoconitis TaxID=188932 RepID=A0A7X0JA70_9SPHI|nr:phosphoglycerol transferase MdoB-like AlkP superfamily enzyme [Pedobacter cryoconitis]